MGSADTGSPRDRGADDGRASPGDRGLEPAGPGPTAHRRLGIAGVACRHQPARRAIDVAVVGGATVSRTRVGTASSRSARSASSSERQPVLGRPSRWASSRSRADVGVARARIAARGGFPVMGSPGRATRRRTRARGRPTYRGPHARGVGEPSGSTPGVGRARRGARRRRRGSAGGSVLVVMEPAGRARLGCPAGSRGVTRVAGHL